MADRKRRGRVWRRLFVFLAVVPLAGVLVALAAGASPHRLRPVAGFLTLAAISGAATIVTERALRRRLSRLKQAPVPRNQYLAKPWWVGLRVADISVHYLALLGAIVAGVGFPGVGVGFLLVVGVVSGGAVVFDFGQPRGLTFETAGLRLHWRSLQILLPWNTIRGLETIGPEGFDSVDFQISDPERVVDWVTPDTPRNRSRAQKMFGTSAPFFWFPWTAGLDGQTLARGIREGIAGQPEQVN